MTQKVENTNTPIQMLKKALSCIMCHIFGHDYKLKRKITPYLREIECKRCKRQFGMHDELRCVLPLDDELRDCDDYIYT